MSAPRNPLLREQIYCQNRKIWVASTPEERWRQRILHFMLTTGGYPPNLIATEVAMGPRRRADIVCYHKREGLEGLFPLLLVECKAHKLPPQTLLQTKGYNFFLKAKFVALTSPQQSAWGWFQSDIQQYIFQTGFPSYQELLIPTNAYKQIKPS